MRCRDANLTIESWLPPAGVCSGVNVRCTACNSRQGNDIRSSSTAPRRLTSPKAISGTVASTYSRTNLPAAKPVLLLSARSRKITAHTQTPRSSAGMRIDLDQAMARGQKPRKAWTGCRQKQRTVALDVVKPPAIKADISSEKRQPGRDVLPYPLLHIAACTERSLLRGIVSFCALHKACASTCPS